MRFKLALLLLLVLVYSCGCPQRCLPETQIVEKTVTVRIVERDSLVSTQPDSSYAQFHLKVDESGTITADPINKVSGRKLQPPKLTVDKNNTLSVDCISEAEQLFLKWKEIYTDSVSKTVIQLPPKLIEKELSNWQIVQMWCGRAFIGIFILVLIWVCIRLYVRYYPK